jgi:uncharacterized protein with HEPN domain
MSQRRVYLDYIQDMVENAQKALFFIEGMNFEEFSTDEKTIYAVVRAIEVIGESVRNIPEDLRNTYSEIPWREIVGTRDKLIHEYFGVNLNVVWRTVKEDLPTLITQLTAILDDYGYTSQ